MSKKLTKKQLTKANKVVGGRAVYGDSIRNCNAFVITTSRKKATKKGAKGQIVVP